ncbi:hypothetical protein GOARA_048_01030 [Gordonia araii NBRC 100433]|uniref:DUF6777 domain-containing protein n=1 Tax=Gordonia araii NBRC 100433 TaxID=1073574 RepID=G7H226_9ACTN|nr:DUF6777 domain-containing protein [Gordonia araii]NNG97234.1 hypothetical protein [Gordonia araii NBRC 100433]GAB09901.1 hypothetical protein GOARA_048_01030 [Gordonia araii NBRC 100433]
MSQFPDGGSQFPAPDGGQWPVQPGNQRPAPAPGYAQPGQAPAPQPGYGYAAPHPGQPVGAQGQLPPGSVPPGVPGPPGTAPSPDRRVSVIIVSVMAVVVLLAGVVGVGAWYLGFFGTGTRLLASTAMAPGQFVSGKPAVVVGSVLDRSKQRSGRPDRNGTVSGTDRGLYAAATTRLTCEVGPLVSGLESDTARRSAFASVMGSSPTQVVADTLNMASLVLLHDTKVAAHSYVDGKVEAYQAVLEAGTPVLVDASGMPRVRCSGGVPLGAPESGAKVPRSGEWSGYSASKVVTVTPGGTASGFDAVDVDKGAFTTIPLGLFTTDLKGTWTSTASWNSDQAVTLELESSLKFDGKVTYGNPYSSRVKACIMTLAEQRREPGKVFGRLLSVTPRKGCLSQEVVLAVRDNTVDYELPTSKTSSLRFTKRS